MEIYPSQSSPTDSAEEPKKQEYETRQIKTLVHGPEGAADLEATFALTEKARAPLEKAILAAKKPADHTITIAAAP